MIRLRDHIRRFRQHEAGTTTVEFVITLPLILMFLLSSIDYGVVMLRQVFMDRAVDIAVRQVRLGNVRGSAANEFRQLICSNTFLIGNCTDVLTVELRPVDTLTWSGLDDPAQCVNREADLEPVLAFIPGGGNQELMLIRVCAVVDPFLDITGLTLGLPQDNSGGYHIVSHAAFANEPV